MLFGLTQPQLTLFAILTVAIVLLVTEALRVDVVAVLIILALYVTGVLSGEDALNGFRSEPAIVIACIFVLSCGLQGTGLAGRIGDLIGRLAGDRLWQMLLVMIPAVALLSAFTHHVTITAVMLPVALSLARERHVAASRLLMPLAIGSSMGTAISVIGAPSFLVSSQLLQQAGRPALGLFSISPIGLALTIAGTIYLVLLGRWLLPERQGAEDPGSRFKLDEYFTELRILKDSALEGKTVREIHDMPDYDFKVVARLHAGRQMRTGIEERPLHAGDVLLIRASPDDLLTIKEQRGVALEPVVQYGDGKDGRTGQKKQEKQREKDEPASALAQAVIAPGSNLGGRSLSQIDFRRRYGAVVVGLWRQKKFMPEELSETKLQTGDVLVIQGDQDALERIAEDRDFLMVMPFRGEGRQHNKEWLASAIMLGTILLAAFDVLSLAMATPAGAVAMVVTRCITVSQAYRSIDQRLYIFSAGAIPLGTAMQKTEAAKLLGGWLNDLTAGWNQVLVLLVIFLAIGVIVQFMGSDAATVAIFAPVAIAMGAGLGMAPEPYVIAVAMAAVTVTLTPMSHHNLIIYGPGGYRFGDYFRVGAPLTLISGAIVALLAPVIWHG